jgi:hypothetical protein
VASPMFNACINHPKTSQPPVARNAPLISADYLSDAARRAAMFGQESAKLDHRFFAASGVTNTIGLGFHAQTLENFEALDLNGSR